MGYACPVCDDPQADAEHLANHLAFTAMLGDEAHESWLDEHAPDWAAADADSLATTVTEHAEETEFPQVFEDTTDQRQANDRTAIGGAEAGDSASDPFGGASSPDRARHRAEQARDADAETRRIVEEARELTERMRGEDDAGDDSDGDDEKSETE